VNCVVPYLRAGFRGEERQKPKFMDAVGCCRNELRVTLLALYLKETALQRLIKFMKMD